MSNIYIRSNYNAYPGTSANYDFRSGYEIPLLPDVNLFRSFNYILYADTANSQLPSTYQGETNTPYQGYASTGIRAGVAPNSTREGVYGANIFKIPSDVNWVTNGGPSANGICFNEKGDWFTAESLGTADSQGQGVKLSRIVNTGTKTVTLYTNASTPTGTATQTHTAVVNAWPDLAISGAYNNAVFCYNKFEYTNDDTGKIYEAKSLFQLPEKFDNLVSFIPDEREKTTLTFTIRVDWVRYVDWGIWGSLMSPSDQNRLLADYSIAASGTEYHTVTHVVNNTNNYSKILNQILDKRQRPLEDQDERYGQTFPATEFESIPKKESFPPESIGEVTESGVTYYTI